MANVDVNQNIVAQLCL